MPAIFTSKTRALYERPPEGDFVLNEDCAAAQGLVAWWPLTGHFFGRELDHARKRKFPLTRSGAATRYPIPDGGFGYANNGTSTIYLNNVATPPVTGIPFTFNCFFRPVTSTHYGATSNLIHVGNGAGSNYVTMQYDGANTSGSGAGAHAVVVDNSGGGANVRGSSTTLAAAGTTGMASFTISATNSHTIYLNGVGTLSTATVTTPTGWDRYTVGAYRDASTFGPLNGTMWWATIHSVVKSDAQVRRMYDPKTRYELAHVLGRRTYGFNQPPAANAVWLLTA